MDNYSVLMSVYQAEKPEYLRQSMESIFAQTIPTNDFVLMCDGPLTKELDLIIQEMCDAHQDILHVIRLERNQGLGNALNCGLVECRNELIARMDSDDVAIPNRCELQLKKFQEDPGLAIIGGAIDEFEGSIENVVSHKDMPHTHQEILQYMKMRNPFNHPTVMYRKSVILGLGGYPYNILHEDYALWANLLLSGARGYNLPNSLCRMRVDNGMYNRRGGFAYLKSAFQLRWDFYKKGLYTFGSFLFVLGGLTLVCLVPVALRKKIYRRFLR